MVPPVPTPEMRMSTLPSVSFQISGPVVSKWILGFAGLRNCWRMKPPGVSRASCFGHRNRALHALGTGGEDEFRAEGAQQHAALLAHGVGHGDDQAIAFDRGDEGQPDAGIAAGRLDQHGLAGLDLACLLGLFDHADADAVFDARAGIESFELGGDLRLAAFGHFVEIHQGGVADQLGYIICDLHEWLLAKRCGETGDSHLKFFGRNRVCAGGRQAAALEVNNNRSESGRGTGRSRDIL